MSRKKTVPQEIRPKPHTGGQSVPEILKEVHTKTDL